MSVEGSFTVAKINSVFRSLFGYFKLSERVEYVCYRSLKSMCGRK